MRYALLVYCVLAAFVLKSVQTVIVGKPVPPDKLKYDQNEALELTNRLRSRHQAPPLQYNEELLQKATDCAKSYVQLGKIDHSCPFAGNEGYGENLAFYWHYANISYIIQDAIQTWYNGIKDYDIDDPEKSMGLVTGHFTQLVWKSSRWVGMDAIKTEGDKTFVVAIYDPPGNIEKLGLGTHSRGGQFGLYKKNVLPGNGGAASYNVPSSVHWLFGILGGNSMPLNDSAWHFEGQTSSCKNLSCK